MKGKTECGGEVTREGVEPRGEERDKRNRQGHKGWREGTRGRG